MSEFQRAAEKAADEIVSKLGFGGFVSNKDISEKSPEIIAKHFSDLRSTYSKLAELAIIDKGADILWGTTGDMFRYDKLLADPQVQAAIGGNEK